MQYEDEVKKMVKQLIPGDQPINKTTQLKNIGIDSLNFVRLVVAIETAFDFEFPDDKLLIDECGTIEKLCEIIQEKLR